MSAERHPALRHGRRAAVLRSAMREASAAMEAARSFTRSAFMPTERERDALCVFLVAVAVLAMLCGAVF